MRSIMRGVEFKRTSDVEAPLSKLFNKINLEEYNWVVLENEIVRNNVNLDLPDVIYGEQFKEVLFGQNDMIIFLNIQAYPKNSNPAEIANYNDYLNSECEIVFLITDLYWVEVYAKNKNILYQFIENGDQCLCKDNKIRTDQQDGRTRFTIW